MPWKEPGKGNKDPWQSGSDRPPDLDDVFRSLSDKVRRIFGGKGNSGGQNGPPVVALVLIGLLLWSIYDSPHIVDESERGVVLRFGEYVRTVDPGLQFTFPRPIERMIKENVSRVRSQQDRGLMLTSDENLINIGFEVQYLVNDPQKFLFNVRDPERTVLDAADSAMREVVGTNQMDFILEEGRGAVALEARTLIQEILDRYDTGIGVTQFNLPDVKPPPQVQDAFDDVVKAREDQERFVNEAQAYANKVVPEARGTAARIDQEAEAYQAAKIALAEGEAERFNLLMSEYQKAPEVTRQRLYLQTMENVLSRSSKVLLDTGESNNLLYLPLDRMGSSGSSGRIIPPVNNLAPGGNSNSRNQDSSVRSGRSSREDRQ